MADATTSPAPGSLEEQAMTALLDVVRTANSPDITQAQAILLRRLALEGDVVASRIPAARNISEIGGYINLLGDLGQTEMRAQALAGILGVAGPNLPAGWVQTQPPLTFTSFANDRPAGSAQAAIPLTAAVRSDFEAALLAALKVLHDQGCALPLLTPARGLPAAVDGSPPPNDALPFLGRSLNVVPAAALADPDADPIALARQGGDPYQLVARVIAPGTVAVAAASWDALKCDTASCTTVPAPAAGRQYITLAPVLAAAGFYAYAPLPQPASAHDHAWSRLTNVTGLVEGTTRLGDELSLLYATGEVAVSAFATRLNWVWDGTSFSSHNGGGGG
jgi:hypothetical protein